MTARKRLAHELKRALFRRATLDAWLDDRLAPGRALGATALGRSFLRLLPERAVRVAPFGERAAGGGSLVLLTLVPPEDTGGGSRPAQLAAELHRRGWTIDWRYALPIFPWPSLRRPAVPGLGVTFLDGSSGGGPPLQDPTLVLVEAPHPLFLEVLERLRPGTRVLYDAIDVWDGTLGAGWYDAAAETAILGRATALAASSALLRDELAQRTGRDVALVENGVDPHVFDATVPRPAPPDLRRGAPTVVYVGALWGDWVDLDLVAAVARMMPEASFNLIGAAGTRRLPAAGNVVALGPRPQREVPAYLAAADVAIVPFVTSRLSAAVSPLKAFEYLAMARPVVSTPLPELRDVPGVTIADDASAFSAAIVAATLRPFPREQAAAFVAGHTWQARVDRLLNFATRDVRVPPNERTD
jgi:glycosyltransferase involved in cell wall biosynthesis